MNPRTQLLLSCNLLETLPEVPSLWLRQAGAEVVLVLSADTADGLKLGAPRGRETQGVRAAVGGVGIPLDQPRFSNSSSKSTRRLGKMPRMSLSAR